MGDLLTFLNLSEHSGLSWGDLPGLSGLSGRVILTSRGDPSDLSEPSRGDDEKEEEKEVQPSSQSLRR